MHVAGKMHYDDIYIIISRVFSEAKLQEGKQVKCLKYWKGKKVRTVLCRWTVIQQNI